jgi:HAD superfamily hydrolase (TIGR01509 family)
MKPKVLLFDFSRVLIFPIDDAYTGLLNDLYKKALHEDTFQFHDFFKFNEALLAHIKPLASMYTLAIFTTDVLQNDPAAKKVLAPIFSRVIAANELGISKKDPKGYLVVAEKLGVKPNEILFIDDTLGNIETAQMAGLQTIHFISNSAFFNELQTRLTA